MHRAQHGRTQAGSGTGRAGLERRSHGDFLVRKHEPLRQPAPVATAARHGVPAGEQEAHVAVAERFESGDGTHVHDRRAMYALEQPRVEERVFEPRERLAHHVHALVPMQPRVVAVRLDPLDFREAHDEVAIA